MRIIESLICGVLAGIAIVVGMKEAPILTSGIILTIMFIAIGIFVCLPTKKPEAVVEPLPGLSKLDDSDKYAAERQKMYGGLGIPPEHLKNALVGATMGAPHWGVTIPEGGLKPSQSGPFYFADPFKKPKPIEVSQVDEKTRENIFLKGVEKLNDRHDWNPTSFDLVTVLKEQYGFTAVVDDKNVLLHNNLPGVIGSCENELVWRISYNGITIKTLNSYQQVHLLMQLFDIAHVNQRKM